MRRALFFLLLASPASAHAELLEITCGQSGQGLFRIEPATGSLFQLQSGLLGRVTTRTVGVESFRKLDCAFCYRVSGEFFVGAENVVVIITTKYKGNSLVADIENQVNTGDGGTTTDVPCDIR